MKNLLNDETLTAYVLDELDDKERDAVEKALETNKEAEKTVEQLRITTKIATEALLLEPVVELSNVQRDEIRSTASEKTKEISGEVYDSRRKRQKPPWYVFRWRYGMAGIAAIPLVIIAAIVMPKMMRSRMSYNEPRARMQHPAQMDYDGDTQSKKMELARNERAGRRGRAGGRPADAKRLEVVNGAVHGEHLNTGWHYIPKDQIQALGYLQSEPASPYDDPNLNYWPGHNTETYDRIVDNPFLAVSQNPLSTFSVDVDTASYANMRRFINQNMLPPKDAIRIEELINYFSYDYEPPEDDVPFSANVEIAGCPWSPDHRLAMIGLKGLEIPYDERPASNLVFLLDVSGSMGTDTKLPLLKKGMKMLTNQLSESDSVSIVVYAGASGLVLPPTPGDNKEAIIEALDRLKSGGSTNGGQGIQLAYDTAVQNFIKGGNNRVILATDGDFNVGVTNDGDLVRTIEKKAKSGVFLTVLGFGMGNIKDSRLEQLADKGNGNYAYIDSLKEAKKVLVEEMGSTLVTIAKDVKIQVEFNPTQVKAYRLIGYENRMLRAEDFNDDTKDAGEIGAGHTVTALYEIVPAGGEIDVPAVDDLKYQQQTRPTDAGVSGDLLTLKLRYKQPDEDKSSKLEFPIRDKGKSYSYASTDFKFAASVASFGMLMRESEHKGNATFDSVVELAEEGKGQDKHGYRKEFVQLVEKARTLKR